MRKYLWLITTLFLLLSTSSCIDSIYQSAENAAQLDATDETESLISLERTICFGTCPVYIVTIYADGTVIYNGESYVRKTGERRSSISEEELQELIREFERINFFNYDDNYGYTFVDDEGNVEIGTSEACQTMITDHPSAITTFALQGKTKTVNHYYGCQGFPGEAELTNLESMIDEVTNTAQWIGD